MKRVYRKIFFYCYGMNRFCRVSLAEMGQKLFYLTSDNYVYLSIQTVTVSWHRAASSERVTINVLFV